MTSSETERGRGPRNQPAAYFVCIAALVAGLAIAWMDTRPTWDDTGVTAAALIAVAGLTSLVGVRPWLAALLVVFPLVIAEIGHVGAGLILAPALAIVGAYGGAMVRQLVVRPFAGIR